jgi:hypothetical protein
MGGFLVVLVLGAVSGLWLPFIHYDEADGPDGLKAPGVTVQPGQRIDLRFADGTYQLTVASVSGARDATVEAFTPECEADPDYSTCIDDDVLSR